jgi:hypothetical protein
MRYVRPVTFRLNPRQEISLLDPVVTARSGSRYTFTEGEVLTEVWASGEDVRLREDTRFWELEGNGQFQLAQHTLANEVLADRLWQAVWDGKDVESEMQRLDILAGEAFHVFCASDPRFIKRDGGMLLASSPTATLPEPIRKTLDELAGDLLTHHRESRAPLNTRQLIELLLRIKDDTPVEEDDVDRVESWLCDRPEWAEIARGLWLPSDLVPSLQEPPRVSVWRIRGGDDEKVTAEECQLVESSEDEATKAGASVMRLPDPPVERHPDSVVSWTHILRTVHILGNYLPVPTGARFRYPRFVGHGVVAISALSHDTGREDFLWLDREHHRFFGDLLGEIIEWEEAGRKLSITWRPEGVVVRIGEVDSEVQQEERRHIDPHALRELRLGRGESYRQSLATVLREHADGMDFRTVFEELVKLQGHQPSRSSIRCVLSQSPEFFWEKSLWKWRSVGDAAEVFRRRLVLTEVSDHSRGRIGDLGSLADAVGVAIRELLS